MTNQIYDNIYNMDCFEGMTVLDNCMGSGTTAMACKNTGRHYIGYETDKVYCDAARERLNTI